ncbi:MAG: nitroreductase family protein [Candidatus Riflebacteria bacterium]|nr:nitroreductase family protein [Candidatus Riflebacteria bacterium]
MTTKSESGSSSHAGDSRLAGILGRRSIRLYTDQSVSESLVNDILRAAMTAPSAGNQQPWHFIVIRDRAVLDAVPTFHPYAGMIRKASVAILVCGDERLEKFKGYWVQDCSTAAENILLAIHLLGLGGVWLGIYPGADRIKGCAELFHLPTGVTPLCLIPFGYPAEVKGPEDRFRTDRIHQNVWG